jgi:hypothetical protein
MIHLLVKKMGKTIAILLRLIQKPKSTDLPNPTGL